MFRTRQIKLQIKSRMCR